MTTDNVAHQYSEREERPLNVHVVQNLAKASPNETLRCFAIVMSCYCLLGSVNQVKILVG